MRSRRLYAHDPKGLMPRMSWSPHNLYNLIARSSSPMPVNETSFKKTSLTMYQQRWRAKRLLRGYHGDWIRERRFKRWFLPLDVPRIPAQHSEASSSAGTEERMPIASLFVRDVERRLDTVVFRCCFARSAREARALVIQGKVRLNGDKVLEAGKLLRPGDLVSVDPSAIPMLGAELAKKAEEQRAADLALKMQSRANEKLAATQEDAPEQAEQAEQAAQAEDGAQTEQVAHEEAQADESQAAQTDEAQAAQTDESQAAQTTAQQAQNVSSETIDKGKGKAREDPKQLPPGVHPFNLPPYASPFLFIPPHIEVSFTTCSAIYMRDPTITKAKRTRAQSRGSSVSFHTDVASPYPATGEIFSMAWEYYTRTAPRIRSDLRRLRQEARVGRSGIASARAKDEWKKKVAERRGHTKEVREVKPVARKRDVPRQFVVGGGVLGKRRSGKQGTSGRMMEKGQAKGKGSAPQVVVGS